MRSKRSPGLGLAIAMACSAGLLLSAGLILLRAPMEGLHAAEGEPPLARRILLEKDDAWRRQARSLERAGLRVLGDYGRFVLAEMADPGGRSILRRAGVRIRREMEDGVRLHRRTLGAADDAGAAPGPGLHVMKFEGPVRPEWVAALRSLRGVRILSALPESAYLVWLPRDASAALARLPRRPELTARLAPSDRISPDLDGSGDPVVVAAWFISTPEGHAAAAAALDRSSGIRGPAPRLPGLTGVLLSLTRAELEEIATWQELVWAEPWGAISLHDEVSSLVTAGQIAGKLPPGPHYREWLTSMGLDDLSSWTVHVVDSGIDTGLAGASHPALAGRVISAGNETFDPAGDDCVGHGTHIAGIVAGNPVPGSDLADGDGFEYGLGMAPSARLAVSRVFNCSGDLEVRRTFTEIFTDAWDGGARVSNNSWGMIGAAYNALASEFDAIVRDVDGDPADGEQPMVVIASTGNLGPLPFTLGTPALAKNVIAVGATESVRPEGTDGCGTNPESADSADELRTSSSRGPTADGRVKPDLVAPGSHILSTVSQADGYTGLGLCNTYYPPGQRLYTWTSGTSQSAAHVSGAAVLVMEDYRREFGAAPSPAMVKAALVATARDLGTPGAIFTTFISSRPSFDQGWGRVDLSGLVGGRARFAEDQSHLFTSSGQDVVRGPFFVADPARPAAVVLAWTDAPGTPAGSSWVNDLDLEVVTSSESFLGNVMHEGFSVPGGQHDARNNLEAVFLPAGSSAFFTVRITAVSLPGDGVPGAPGATDQDFALYVDNVITAAPEGSIRLTSREVSCTSSARVTVTGRSLHGVDRIRVEGASGSETAPESFELSETPPGSGIFQGEIPIAPGPPARDGLLQASDGDTFAVSYRLEDPATGAMKLLTAPGTVRCSALSISDVRFEAAGTNRAAITWKTSRPADSVVTGVPALEISDPSLVTNHRIIATGLAPCTSYAITLASTDLAGTAATAPATGTLLLNTASSLRMPLFRDDLERLTAGWSHGGAGDEWELGSPQTGPPRAASGSRAWGTDLDGSYENVTDSHLTLPPVKLRGLRGAALEFRHFLGIPKAVNAGDPQDGAWIEASTDEGLTWIVLGPDGGYPVDAGPNNPYLPPGSGVFAGTSNFWSDVQIDLSSLRGESVLIRFRLWRDPAAASPPGAGWYIDDVAVEAGVPCGAGTLALDSADYGCNSLVGITLADEDVDSDPFQIGFASILAETSSSPVAIQLRESAPDSRIYTGTLQLSGSGAPGAMEIAEGETLTVRYEDRDDGTRSPITVETAVTIPDCTAPAPPGSPEIEPAGGGRLLLRWDDPPDPDLAQVRIHYDSDGPGPIYNGLGAAEGASPLRAEVGRSSAILSGLPACLPHFISLTAIDDFGNESAFSPELVAVPFTGAPCTRATILLAEESGAGCSQVLPIRIDDANADPSPMAPGVISILAAASSDPSPLSVVLTETGPATGVFTGTIPLSPDPAAGRLRVAEGDEIVVTYADADTGSGAGAPITARLPVDDCRSPIITDLRPPRLDFGSVRVEFTTDEPATPVIEFGLDPGLEASIQGAPLATTHSIELPSFVECAPLYYRITATDHRGNATVADDDGLPFQVGASRILTVFSDDLEAGAPGWTPDGSQDGWELGSPQAGPPGAASGIKVWGTNLDGTYGVDADMTLVSPLIDLEGLDSAVLIFNHWYDIHTSTPGAGFDDGGWVEVSKDRGVTWTYIAPDGGYPDVIETNPYIASGAPVYAGQTADWEEAIFQLDAFAGHEILIRFHLFQDPFDPPEPGLGWYIDDVRIRAAAPCRQGRIHLDLGSGDCGASPLTVRVWDADLDLDPNSAETITVSVESSSDPAVLDAVLTETGPSTGQFGGTLPFSRAGGPGILRVLGGDTVTATYEDADDGTGGPATAVATGSVRDCTPPEIRHPSWQRLGANLLEITWETDEPGDSEVQMPPGSVAAASSALSTIHRLTMPAPAHCAAASFTIASTDAGGNRSIDDNGGAGYPVESAREIIVFSEDFESGAAGWEHGGDPDEWEVGPPLAGPPGPWGGASVAGTDLDGPYDKDPHRQRHESWLLTPYISLEGLEAATLSMMHFHSFAGDTRGDGGLVEVLDRGRWVSVAPLSGYPGSLRTDRASGSLPAFVEESAGWIEARFDLAAFIGRSIRVSFRMVVDHGTPATAEGWYLDDVRVSGTAPCRRGILALDREEYGCEAAGATVLLSDADLDLDPGSMESVVVEVSDGTTLLAVNLMETGPATGLFRGEAPLSVSGAPGSLRLEEGIRITATYDDADSGSGGAATVEAEALVRDCRAPVLTAVRPEPLWSGALLTLRWETDEPATTEAALLMSGRPPRTLSLPDLITEHVARFYDVPDCTSFTIALASRDAAGNVGAAPGGSQPLTGETRSEVRLFQDDMEGSPQGWTSGGAENEWERGVPVVGPPGAFSGSSVSGTDLLGLYAAGTNSYLRTPILDLRGVTSAVFSFWHFYDVFANGTPNADDDGGWVEVLPIGAQIPIYVMPIEGYNNTIDRDGGSPIQGGSGVFAGSSGGWQRSVLDLSPFAGKQVQVQFHIWNDVVEGPINRNTGAGWYIDDVEASAPGTCFPAPVLDSASSGVLTQGSVGIAITFSGSGLREPFSLSAGDGIVLRDATAGTPGSWTALADVAPGAASGPRSLVVRNPDGQEGVLPGALIVGTDPSRADIDGSGLVDDADLALLAASFGSFIGEPAYRQAADLTGDGIVDGRDLAILASAFGQIPAP